MSASLRRRVSVAPKCCLRRGSSPRADHGAVSERSVAFAVAASYALLAGFGLPTRRSLVMLAVALTLWVLARRSDPWRAFAVALATIVLVWPLSVLTAAFWLSFGVVALLITASARDRGYLGGWQSVRFVRYQCLIGIASLAASAALFNTVPWAGLIANLVLIPLVGVVLLPALIGALVLLPVTPLALELCGHATAAGLHALAVLEQSLQADVLAPPVTTLIAASAVAWLPTSLILRALAIVAVTLALDRAAGHPVDAGCSHVDILDVGQGLAVLVRAREHAMLVDTGPSWTGGSAVRSSVLPLLAARGVDTLDLVVLSHADNDHAGGAGDLVAAGFGERWLSGEPYALTVPRVRACRRGQLLRFGPVVVRVLGPPDHRQRGNNASCVLSLAIGGFRLLLPGDIEAAAERELLRSVPDDLVADVVLMPHHGSRSSSTLAFVEAVQPRYAIASAGYRNRWRFPNSEVVRRWQHAGASVMVTGRRGGIELNICPGRLDITRGERMERARWWRVPND